MRKLNKKAGGDDAFVAIFGLFAIILLGYLLYCIISESIISYIKSIYYPLWTIGIIWIILFIVFTEIIYYYVVKNRDIDKTELIFLKLLSIVLSIITTYFLTMISWGISSIIKKRQIIWQHIIEGLKYLYNQIVTFFHSKLVIGLLCGLLIIIMIILWFIMNIKIAEIYWIKKPKPKKKKKKKKKVKKRV